MDLSSFKKDLSFGDLFSMAFGFFKDNFMVIMYITLIVYIPLEIISGLYTTMSVATEGNTLQGLKVISNLEAFIGIIATIGVYVFIKEKIFSNNTLNALESIKKGFGYYGQGLVVNIIAGLIIVLGFIALVIPGIYFAVCYSFILMMVVFLGVSGMDALSESKELVKGIWWRVFGYGIFSFAGVMLISFVIAFLMGFVIGFVGSAAGGDVDKIIDSIYFTVISSLITDILMMFFTVMMAFLFLNIGCLKGKFNSQFKPVTQTAPAQEEIIEL